jgi:hypothetical protein
MKGCFSAAAAFACFAVLALPSSADAQALRLDDSTSPRAQVQSLQILSEQGRRLDAPSPDAAPQYAIARFGNVEYRLATAPYMGHRARIFFVVPAVIPGMRQPSGVKVDWHTGGLFAPGSARGGERKLVWSGVVRQPFMVETLDLTMQFRLADVTARPGAGISFESYFEIEVTP